MTPILENPKVETRRPKEIRNPNIPATANVFESYSDFGIRASFGLRVSAFGLNLLQFRGRKVRHKLCGFAPLREKGAKAVHPAT